MANLMEGLIEETNRCRELVRVYEELPNGVGRIGATLIKQDIAAAEAAMGSGDVVGMVKAYQALKDCN